jgi:hypothetical protein
VLLVDATLIAPFLYCNFRYSLSYLRHVPHHLGDVNIHRTAAELAEETDGSFI